LSLDQATMEFRARAPTVEGDSPRGRSVADLEDGRTENDRLNGHSYIRGIEKRRVIGKY